MNESNIQERQYQANQNGSLLLLSIVLFVGVFLLFFQTAMSMINTWIVAETYTHGFLILPISIWLAWRKRRLLATYNPEPQYWALLPLLAAGATWLIADLVGVLVVQQLMLVAILVSSFWLITGNRIASSLIFPLGYLFFMVPMGDFLVPIMMEYTANVLVALIKLTGIPVYRDSLFISLPTGNWAVVDACSGVRYIIASVTLGCLFAYLNYRSLKRKIVFIAVSALVPVLANGLRAFMIVMIGHFSGMTLAVGVDHLIYGWVFFGVVMLILFSIGSRWSDDKEQPALELAEDNQGFVLEKKNWPRLCSGVIVTFLVAAAWPFFAYSLSQQPINNGSRLVIPTQIAEWSFVAEQAWDWKPLFVSADHTFEQWYQQGEATNVVGLYVAQYATQRQGAEIINAQNRLANKEFSQWRVVSSARKKVQINSTSLVVTEANLRYGDKELLVWRWYRVGSHRMASKYIAKVAEIEARLLEGRRDAAIITLAAGVNGGLEVSSEVIAARERLRAFVADALPKLEQSLDQAVGVTE